ncbi:copper resistance protein NlpE [Shewanella violacea]
MKLPIITVSLLALCITACSEQEIKTSESKPQIQSQPQAQLEQVKESQPQGDTSRTSLDWQATYSGVIPCASCEGIKTVLTLKQDNTYVLESIYLGTSAPGEKPNVFTEAGPFQWNDAGNTISLMGDTSELAKPKQYRVGESQLMMLDRQGNTITGSLADNYRLEKKG